MAGVSQTSLSAWHALRLEAPIDASEEIVDAHHHLWDQLNESNRPLHDLARVRALVGCRVLKALVLLRVGGAQLLGFMRMHLGHSRSFDAFCAPYLAEQLKADFGGLNVVATVYLQCGWAAGPAGEVTQQRLSRAVHGLPSAVVGELDVQLGPVVAAQTIDECRAACGDDASFLVGFRTTLACPSPSDSFNGGHAGALDSAESVAATKLLAARGLVLDVCTVHLRLDEVTRLALAAPEATIVLDHLGFPIGVGKYAPYGAVLEAWRAAMRRLAACPNVHVKLSGLGMAIFGFRFPFAHVPPSSDECVDAWYPLVHFTLQTFGVTRCFFASNFPPDAASCSYVTMWNAYRLFSR